MNSKTTTKIDEVRNAATELLRILDLVGPEDGLSGIMDKINNQLRVLKDIKISRADALEQMLITHPDWYGPLPSHLYEINSKAMHALKEQMVSNILLKFPGSSTYSKTTSGGFFNMGRTVEGENIDLPMEIFQVDRDDVEAYLADWLKCNGGHTQFQFNLEQAQRHEALIDYVGDGKGDDIATAMTGNLYVADVSGRKSWLYKTQFFMHTHVGNRKQDLARLIENLHEFYDTVFKEQGLTMRVIYVQED